MNLDNPIRLFRYEPKFKAQWDEFVRSSKNGAFLFCRDYLEYHSDRFKECSFLFFQGDRLVGLMPGNQSGETVESHGGLTFGGIITDSKMTISRMLQLFSVLIAELSRLGIRKLIYKAVPHMYHQLPSEEDLYALFVHGARLCRRDVSSTIVSLQRIPMMRSRRKVSNRCRVQGLRVAQTEEFSKFMVMAEANLQRRHGLSLVHTATEMQLLASRFPENIKLFTVNRSDELLGGVIIYESAMVAHGQYRHSTEEGMRVGALDLLLDVLVNEIYLTKPYIDFGISMEDDGRILNSTLVMNKESFGARTTIYDFYELDIVQ